MHKSASSSRDIAAAYVGLLTRVLNRKFIHFNMDTVGGHSAEYPDGAVVGDAFLGAIVTRVDPEVEIGMVNGVLFSFESGKILASDCGVEVDDEEGEILVCDYTKPLTLSPAADLMILKKLIGMD